MSPRPSLSRIPRTMLCLEGPVADYVKAVSDNWIKIAPYANPGMLEMLRDRDRRPWRNLLPWAGWFSGLHLISSVQMLRINAEPELRNGVQWFVNEVISLQADDGYIGPFPKGFRLRNFAPNVHGHDGSSWDTSGHYYMMLGLLLWHEDTGDAASLAAARKIGDALCRLYLGNERRIVDTGCSEMNLAPAHSLVVLYRHTGDERYLALARQIVDVEFAAIADGGEYLAGNYLDAGLAGQDFYTLPKPRWESLQPIMAMVELYYVTAEERYRKAFEHFYWSIAKTDRHNNGGFTTGEKAVGDPYVNGEIESCCTLAWIAYGVEMLRLSGNPVVADELELSTLNSVVGMHSCTGRWSTYSTPMDGVRKASTQDIAFQAREGTPHLNCCSVHAPRGFGLISEWALMKDADGLVINYYGAGTITTTLEGLPITVTQATDYPRTGKVAITVAPAYEREITIKLRIPSWSLHSTVTVDGQRVGEAIPGAYLSVTRLWTGREKLVVNLDMSFHYWLGSGNCTGLTSIYRGPVLLTYDRRFNDMDPQTVPVLDALAINGKLVDAETWLPPILLVELTTPEGILRLCDFGSAGEGGSPYRSWLSVKNAPSGEFSRANPLRSARP